MDAEYADEYDTLDKVSAKLKQTDNPAARPHAPGSLKAEDFFAYLPMHQCIYTPTRDLWPPPSVDAAVGPIKLLDATGAPKLGKNGQQETIKASAWLDRNRHVEQMTWAPGLDLIVTDRLISNGAWIVKPGASCFNLYRAPTIEEGDAAQAQPWLDLVAAVYPDDAAHIVNFFAHRVQKPAEKINHGLVLAGVPGIGKDTLVEPLKYAVGAWNFEEASPPQMLGRFNSFLKAVVLRMSESHDLGEFDRYALHERMKTVLASPPDVLKVDEKHLREYYIANCCAVIITTNHEHTGLYLPPDDRRHYVAWSPLQASSLAPAQWETIWRWYRADGFRHIAAYLRALDLSKFNAKEPPPKTPGFWKMVDANRAPEDADFADIFDEMGNPAAVTLMDVFLRARDSALDFLRDRKNRRAIPHRFGACGYTPIRNDAAQDGLWKIRGKRQVIYARRDLTPHAQIEAARKRTDER